MILSLISSSIPLLRAFVLNVCLRSLIRGFGSKEDTSKTAPLDVQIAAIKKLAKSKGYKLVDIETDNGLSGKSLANRPGAQRVLGLVKDKLIFIALSYIVVTGFVETL
ncbi:MAG: recombinase family protein [Desulfomonilaceae bacterium]